MILKVSESHSVVIDCLWPRGPRNSPSQNTGVSSLSFLQGIFLTQGSNPGLLHCRWILYQLSHKGSLRILQWVAYPFSRGSSWPRNWTGVSSIAGGFFTKWVIREDHYNIKVSQFLKPFYITQFVLMNCKFSCSMSIFYTVNYYFLASRYFIY